MFRSGSSCQEQDSRVRIPDESYLPLHPKILCIIINLQMFPKNHKFLFVPLE